MRALRTAIRGQRRRLAAATVLASTHQAGEALVPVLIGVIIDEAVGTGSVPALVSWVAVLGGVFLVLSTSYRFALRAAEQASEYAGHDLRLDLTRRILDDRGGAERGHLPGELVSVATSDARRVGEVHLVLPFGLAAVTALLVAAAALLAVSLPLGLLVLLGTPPVLLLTHLAGRPLERRTEAEQERAAHAAGVAADLVAGVRVLKGLGAEAPAVARYRRTSRDALGATLRAARALAAHDGIVLALSGVFLALVALVGGRLAAAGEVSVGGLVAAVGLALFLVEPLSSLALANAELAQARASAGRIDAVLAAPPAVAGGTGRVDGPVRGALALRGVRSGVLGGATGVDLDVAPGELLGVVAPDPEVARTLLACLARDVDPDAGTVALDGAALAGLEPAAVRGAVLVAAHDAALFAGPLRESLGAPTPAVLAAAAADEVVESLPDGLGTPIGERGHGLSGGQRQRVALARALAADAPVLVLHDPTTAVDAVTETRIAAALRAVRAGRTTVLVTSSPALLAAADRVVVLEAGGVRVSGRHDELVADAGYRAAVLA